MAKNNMLLGYARGKVGDLVFQRRKGEQIVKARNRNPANPRTWAQQMQRVRMYAPVQFYKTAIENFYRFAFEDKKYNETDYNAFIRENLNAFQGPYFTREQVQKKYPVLAPYIISSGTLGQVPFNLIVGENYSQNYVVVSNEEITTQNQNVGFISRLLMTRYNLSEGDMITFVISGVTGLNIENNGNVVYNGQTLFYYQNFVIDTTSTEVLTNAVPSENNAVLALGQLGEEGYVLALRVGALKTSNTPAIANAVITTRRENGKILASTTRIVLNQNAQNYFEAMSTSQQLIRAAESYDAVNSALDPHAAKVMNEASSQSNVQQQRSTEQTAFNCIPTRGNKTTDGNPAYTLNNECPSCDCPEPNPCGDETVTTTTTTTTRRSTTKKVEE